MTLATGVGVRMRALIARQFSIDTEKAELADSQRELRSDVRTAGFDLRVFNQMVRELRMSHDDRVTFSAKCEIFRASLGMLDGTPLGLAARQMLDQNASEWSAPELALEPDRPGDDPAEAEPADSDEPELFFDSSPESRSPTAEPRDSPQATAAAPWQVPGPTLAERIATAREAGDLAARSGGRIGDNPYPADDFCRTAYDEAYCFAAGSDGMDLPEAFRRKADPGKPGKPAPAADSAA